MFYGQYHHNLDDKGRLTIPVRFRELLLANGAFMVQGLDKNLMVLPTTYFEAISENISRKSLTDPIARFLRHIIFSTANHVEVDRSGRILIPLYLRQIADLEDAVVIVGNREFFEIWALDHWTARSTQLQDFETMTERLAALDITSG